MSVPSWKRKESKVEFLHTFQKLRKETTLILLRDFGIKNKVYSVNLLEKMFNVTDEDDVKALEELLIKYDMNSAVLDRYPSWIIDKFRNECLDILCKIGIELELANNIFISSMAEYDERRIHWDLAIGYCHALKDKFHEILSVFQVKVGAYMVVAELLEKEIQLIKGIRKSDTTRSKKQSWWVDR